MLLVAFFSCVLIHTKFVVLAMKDFAKNNGRGWHGQPKGRTLSLKVKI